MSARLLQRQRQPDHASVPWNLAQRVGRHLQRPSASNVRRRRLLRRDHRLSPDSECAPQAGQSLATNLSGIATEDALFSICGDYSGALASVRAFTERLVDSTLELDLAPEESILAVYAEQGDGGRRLIDPMLYTFDRARGVLELVTGALVAMETGVAVEVENPCVIPPD